MPLRMVQARSPGKFFSPRTTAAKVEPWHRKMVEILEKVTSVSVKSNFGGPAGGSALERASPPKEDYTWLVETTSTTLKR